MARAHQKARGTKTQNKLNSPTLRRVAATSMVATSIEFYDFFIFATAAALIFPKIFFPPELSPLVAQMAAFTTLAVGFLARPLGAAIFGHFGDRMGRKPVLVVALLLMGSSTTLIGLLPSYHLIGAAAPLLLVALRLVQGFALGGQWGGAALIIIESAPPDRRGWYGAFAQVGAPVGTVLANLMFLCVSLATGPEQFLEWGWRIPFLASAVLIVLSLNVHRQFDETAIFKRGKGDTADGVGTVRGSPVIKALRSHFREILLAAGAFVGMQVSFYILVSFSLAYGTQNSAGLFSRDAMMFAVLVGALTMVPGVFVGAALSDWLGRRPVIIASGLALAMWSFLVFPLINTGSIGLVVVALAGGQLLNGIIFGPLAALYSEFFPTQIRYSGMSLGYQLGTLAGGSIAPLVATALFAEFASWLPISAYISATCMLSVVCAFFITEVRGRLLCSVETPQFRSIQSDNRDYAR